MRLAIATLIVSAGAAYAQVNPSFEFGDISGFSTTPESGASTGVVQQTGNGLPPFQGQFAAQVVAGGLTQAQAEGLIELKPGRLAQVLGELGQIGDLTDSDYNVFRVDLPAGTVSFAWVYEGGDVSDASFVDHAFVVTGAQEITVLVNSLAGAPVPGWQQATFEHPGGPMYIVCANGGDFSVDPSLYVDDFRLEPAGNLSFENQLDGWHVEDFGFVHGLAVFQSGSGLLPTDRSLMAELEAGEVTPVSANAIMKLEPGTVESLYTSLGGTGDPTSGDYVIMWRELPPGDVTFDWTVEGGDQGSTSFLDHAFVVNADSEIELLYNGLEAGDAGWHTTTVSHPGGRFYFVCANGGDSAVDPFLYVDNIRAGKASIDSSISWTQKDATNANWGDGQQETFGQTVVPDRDATLRSMTFYINDVDAKPISYEAFVYAWSGTHIVGEALFASGPMTTDGAPDGFEQIVVPTPGARLEKGKSYVGFLTVSNTLPTNAGASWGLVKSDVIPGSFVFASSNANFNALFGDIWVSKPAQDLACRFQLDEPDQSVAPYPYLHMEGGASNAFPWCANTPFRYQQIYRAEDVGARDAVIDAIRYRVDRENGQKFSNVNINSLIWLGYTDKEPGELSSVFDENFTSGKTLVHNGPSAVSSKGQQGFDVTIDLDDVFEYDGESNLLMEVIILDSSNSIPGYLDYSVGQEFGVGAAHTSWTDRVWALDAGAQSGLHEGEGLITRFDFVAPEAPCVADCDENGSLNILDFVCFQFTFSQGDLKADCNGDGQLNIIDFVCFQQAFQSGCE